MGTERMRWLTQQMVGQVIVVKMQDGGQFEGLVVARKPTDKIALELAHVRRKAGDKWKPRDRAVVKRTEVYDIDKIVSMAASEVPLQGFTPPPANTNEFTSSSANRQLEKLSWDPMADMQGGETLDFDDKGYSAGGFDQFAVNERKFGVKSTYNFEDYSTVLDVSKMSKEQLKWAEEKAKEIEGSNRGKGGQFDSTVGDWAADFDEEALHSAVIRESDPLSSQQLKNQEESKNQYVPPHLRGQPGMVVQQQNPQPNGAGPVPAGAVPVQGQQPGPAGQVGPNAQVPTSVLNHHHHLQYRQEGQLQVRQDGGGTPLTPGAAVLPADCYNEGTAVAPQPSPPPPQQRPPPAAQGSPVAQPAAAAVSVVPIADASKRQVNPKPAAVKPGGKTALPAREGKTSKAKEIADFMKSRDELNKLFKKKPTTEKEEAAAPAPSKTAKAPADKAAPAAANKDDVDKLNPNAQPFGNPADGEAAKASPEPEPEQPQPVAPVTPEWKPPLGEGKDEILCVQEKFISSVISTAIYEKLRKYQNKGQNQGANPTNERPPIPGDAEAFKYEWKGDDHYWDEEEDQTGGREDRTYGASGQNMAPNQPQRAGMAPVPRVQPVTPHFPQQQQQQAAQQQAQQQAPQQLQSQPPQGQQPQGQQPQQLQQQPQAQPQAPSQPPLNPHTNYMPHNTPNHQQAQQPSPQQPQHQQPQQAHQHQHMQQQMQQQQHQQQQQYQQQQILQQGQPGQQQFPQQQQYNPSQYQQQNPQQMQQVAYPQQYQQQQPAQQGQPQQAPQGQPAQGQQPQPAAQQFGQPGFTQSPAPPFQQPAQQQQYPPQGYQPQYAQAQQPMQSPQGQPQGMYQQPQMQQQQPAQQQQFNQQNPQHPFAGQSNFQPNQQQFPPQQQQQQQQYYQQQQQQQTQQYQQGRPDPNMQFPQQVNAQTAPGMSPGVPYARATPQQQQFRPNA